MASDKAYRIILLRLLRVMRLSEKGIRQDVDRESLHDFRVSMRRSRALLSRADGILPEDSIEYFSGELAWLGQVTGSLRDYDVWLLSFDHYQQSVPKEHHAGLESLRSWLQQERCYEFDKVIGELTSDRYKNFMKQWHEFLDTDIPARQILPEAKRPVSSVVAKKIRKTYRKMYKHGELINDQSPAQLLHDLRKTGKKLRYLLEFFQPVFPEKLIKSVLKKLEGLQEYLGDYQDFHVQKWSLQFFKAGMQRYGKLTAETEAAMQSLLDSIVMQEKEHRKKYSRYFKSFKNAGIEQLYE